MNKNIICLLAFFTFVLKVTAQPPYGTTVINNDLNKFVGSWQYVSGVDTITVKFKKTNISLPDFGGEDHILGYHTYKRGNTIIENSMQYYLNNWSENLFTFLGSKTSGPNNSIMECRVKDLAKNKQNRLELTISNNNTVLTAKRVRFYGEERQTGFTLPETFTLNKLPPPPPPPPPAEQ